MTSWYVGRFPENRVILTSYEAGLAASYGRKARDLLEEHGQSLWGIEVRQDTRAKDEWDLIGHEGGMITAGVGGAITGRGANLLVGDDLIKNAEEAMSESRRRVLWDWWESTAETRLEPGGIAIVAATRWHEDDPSGRIIKRSQQTGQPILRLRLPALAEDNDPLGRSPEEPLWPGRYDAPALIRIRENRSPYWWNALYQQRPTRHEGAEWPDCYFEESLWAERWPDRFERAAIALDPSKGRTDRSDYSALVFVGLAGGKLWVDADIARRPVPQLIADGVQFWHGHPSDSFIIESNAWQDLLATEFDRYTRDNGYLPLPLRLIENRVKKETRIERLGTYLSRDVLRVRPTAGGKMLVAQMREFPLGEHDDGPDAAEMAIRGMMETEHQQAMEAESEFGVAVV